MRHENSLAEKMLWETYHFYLFYSQLEWYVISCKRCMAFLNDEQIKMKEEE